MQLSYLANREDRYVKICFSNTERSEETAFSLQVDIEKLYLRYHREWSQEEIDSMDFTFLDAVQLIEYCQNRCMERALILNDHHDSLDIPSVIQNCL
jgi:hypothetical protein